MQIYLPVAEMTINAALLLAMGLAVGVLSGLFGIGGGFIVTPMLIFLGVPAPIAVGTGAAQVAASSVSGAVSHWMRRTIDFKMAFILLIGGLFGSSFGVVMQRWLKAIGQLELFIAAIYVVLLGTIGTLMLIESIEALRRSRAAKAAGVPVGARGPVHHNWFQGLPLKMRFPASKLYISTIPPIAIGAAVGWLTAIMGVGGGFLMVPALIYLMRMPTRVVLGTSIFQIVFVTAFTTAMQAWQNQTVDLMLGLPLMIGGVIGAQYGLRLGQRLQAEQLRIILALLVLGVALRITVDLAVPPGEIYTIETLRK